MSNSKSRRKGARAELRVVHYWKPMFPDAHRHLEFREREADEGVDVILNDKIGIQVKIGSQVGKKNYKFINQMKGKDKGIKFVQMRRDYEDWLILLRVKDFKRLLKWWLVSSENNLEDL